MASIWKHPECKNWFARFTDIDGKRCNRSTGTKDTKLARKLAESYESAARKKRTALQMRRVISDLHKEITGDELKNSTVREFAAEWLATKGPETAPATVVFYGQAVDSFLKFLGDANPELTDISRQTITGFRNAEAKRVSATTANHRLKVIRMLFRAARRDGLIADDPAEFVEPVKERAEGDSRRPFTLDELRAILAECDDEWRSLVLFGIYSGQRLGDLARLTWANVDLVQGDLRLVTGKTGKRITLPLAAPLRAHLEALPSSDNPTAPLHPRAFAVVTRTGKVGSLSNAFGDILAAAGLRAAKTHQKAADGRATKREASTTSFHSLRHTATTLLHEKGIPFSVTKEMIGHDSSHSHEGYVTVSREAMNTATASMPDITKP